MICPEFREYERTTTTFLNAYVGPLMDRYLSRLDAVPKLWIMQSNGGVIRAREAREHAVRTLLSGPAGGVVGAIETARLSGFEKVLGFDMGGTSTDVSLSEGTPRHTAEAYIDGIPVRVPMLDIQTVGAGGGSIARVDEGGLLRVGPESAGAIPGPACYGQGEMPTVTDAHVVLGRIEPEHFLGGAMTLYPDRAAAAIDRIARELRLTPQSRPPKGSCVSRTPTWSARFDPCRSNAAMILAISRWSRSAGAAACTRATLPTTSGFARLSCRNMRACCPRSGC